MKNNADLKEFKRKKIEKFDFGEIEIISSTIYKIKMNTDIEVLPVHIEKFRNILEGEQTEHYGLIIDTTNPFFCSEEIAATLSEDDKLLALALLIQKKEKMEKSKFIMELASLLPNPFHIPVKLFKHESYAVQWMNKKMGRF
jgi:hypothetical protein